MILLFFSFVTTHFIPSLHFFINPHLYYFKDSDVSVWFGQVQEKKVKKISELNVDPSKVCRAASSSVSSSPKQYLSNGSYPDRSYNSSRNDGLSFPLDGIHSLRLPMVVVFDWAEVLLEELGISEHTFHVMAFHLNLLCYSFHGNDWLC